MTTKETALALGVSESTIQRHAKELGLTENGKQTELDERAVTIIKTKIERSGRSDLRNVAELPIHFMGETRNTLTEVKERLSAVERLASDTAKRLDALESKERERR